MADKPSENKDSESPDKEEGHVPLAGQNTGPIG
jgi:hypothetical protein